MPTCFVIMPYGSGDEKKRKHFAGVYQSIIAPAATRAGYEIKRSDYAGEPGNITHDIVKDLYDADIVVADVTRQRRRLFRTRHPARTSQEWHNSHCRLHT